MSTTPSERIAGKTAGEQIALATDRATTDELLNALAISENSDVRMSVAINPATPSYLLYALAQDKEADVRAAVSANASTPGYIHQVIADNKDEAEHTLTRSNAALERGEPEERDEEGHIQGLATHWAEGAHDCYDDEQEIDPDTLPMAVRFLLDAYRRSVGYQHEDIGSPLHYFTIHPADAIEQGFKENAFDFLIPSAQDTLREAMEWAQRWKAWDENA